MIASAVAVTLVALMLGAPMQAFAQARPDFSGTWRISQAKSSRNVVGNTPDIQFPSQLDVKQTATDIAVTATSVRQRPVSATYKLDGTKVNVQAPEGITETGPGDAQRLESRHHVAALVLVAGRRCCGRLQGSVDHQRHRADDREDAHAGRRYTKHAESRLRQDVEAAFRRPDLRGVACVVAC
jgi:hypothetical protein